MKRNTFLKSIGGIVGLLALPTIATATTSKKLTQVKAFNIKTVTQKVAAEIMALIAWNHLNEKRFANSFTITQNYRYIKDRRENGVTYTYKGDKDAVEEENGVTIYSPTTYQSVTLFPDGDWKCTLDRTKIITQYENITRNKNTGHETINDHTESGHGLNQLKVASLYLELGFYKY